MKTKEELKQIKEEAGKLGEKLKELNEDELKEVTGGLDISFIKGGATVVANEKISGGPIPKVSEKIVG